MKVTPVVTSAVLMVVGVALYFLASFTIFGWIGIFLAIGGLVLLVRALNQGTPKKKEKLLKN
ncbi:MAG: hypothetical protein M1518_03415 [Candidatus Thermoplasmatota archaeon]|jgi:drug/metabolite transporter (DMT)-like permease|nr:hypothetical protein [Candidatus Thermoplasmatota archaeon]